MRSKRRFLPHRHTYDLSPGLLTTNPPAVGTGLHTRPVTIRRKNSDEPFGFTVRHIAVYPPREQQITHKPDSSRNYERYLSSRSRSSLLSPLSPPGAQGSARPHQSIVISSVQAGSLADRAGLEAGYRVISLNGHPASGQSYESVLRMIQQCTTELSILTAPPSTTASQNATSPSPPTFAPASSLHSGSNAFNSSRTRNASSVYLDHRKSSSSDSTSSLLVPVRNSSVGTTYSRQNPGSPYYPSSGYSSGSPTKGYISSPSSGPYSDALLSPVSRRRAHNRISLADTSGDTSSSSYSNYSSIGAGSTLPGHYSPTSGYGKSSGGALSPPGLGVSSANRITSRPFSPPTAVTSPCLPVFTPKQQQQVPQSISSVSSSSVSSSSGVAPELGDTEKLPPGLRLPASCHSPRQMNELRGALSPTGAAAPPSHKTAVVSGWDKYSKVQIPPSTAPTSGTPVRPVSGVTAAKSALSENFLRSASAASLENMAAAHQRSVPWQAPAVTTVAPPEPGTSHNTPPASSIRFSVGLIEQPGLKVKRTEDNSYGEPPPEGAAGSVGKVVNVSEGKKPTNSSGRDNFKMRRYPQPPAPSAAFGGGLPAQNTRNKRRPLSAHQLFLSDDVVPPTSAVSEGRDSLAHPAIKALSDVSKVKFLSEENLLSNRTNAAPAHPGTVVFMPQNYANRRQGFVDPKQGRAIPASVSRNEGFATDPAGAFRQRQFNQQLQIETQNAMGSFQIDGNGNSYFDTTNPNFSPPDQRMMHSDFADYSPSYPGPGIAVFEHRLPSPSTCGVGSMNVTGVSNIQPIRFAVPPTGIATNETSNQFTNQYPVSSYPYQYPVSCLETDFPPSPSYYSPQQGNYLSREPPSTYVPPGIAPQNRLTVLPLDADIPNDSQQASDVILTSGNTGPLVTPTKRSPRAISITGAARRRGMIQRGKSMDSMISPNFSSSIPGSQDSPVSVNEEEMMQPAAYSPRRRFACPPNFVESSRGGRSIPPAIHQQPVYLNSKFMGSSPGDYSFLYPPQFFAPGSSTLLGTSTGLSKSCTPLPEVPEEVTTEDAPGVNGRSRRSVHYAQSVEESPGSRQADNTKFPSNGHRRQQDYYHRPLRMLEFTPFNQSTGRIVPDPSTPEGHRVSNPFKTGSVSRVTKSISWDCNMSVLRPRQGSFPKDNDRLAQLRIVKKRREEFETGNVDHIGPLKLYHALAYKRELDKIVSSNTGQVLAKAACFESGSSTPRSVSTSDSEWPGTVALPRPPDEDPHDRSIPVHAYSLQERLYGVHQGITGGDGQGSDQRQPLRHPSFMAAVAGENRTPSRPTSGLSPPSTAASTVAQHGGFLDPWRTPPTAVIKSAAGADAHQQQSNYGVGQTSPSASHPIRKPFPAVPTAQTNGDAGSGAFPRPTRSGERDARPIAAQLGDDRTARRSSYILATAVRGGVQGSAVVTSASSQPCVTQPASDDAAQERSPKFQKSRSPRPESFAGTGTMAGQQVGQRTGPPADDKSPLVGAAPGRVSQTASAACSDQPSTSAAAAGSVPPAVSSTKQRLLIGGRVTAPEFVRRLGPLWHKQSKAEDGKKSGDRGWRHFWGLLEKQILYLCKDRPKVEHESYNVPAESLEIPVSGCISDIAYDYTKRKNVFRVTTARQEEHLFQTEDAPEMLGWLEAIHQSSGLESEIMTDDGMSSSMALIIKRYEAAQHNTATSPAMKQKRGGPGGFLRRGDASSSPHGGGVTIAPDADSTTSRTSATDYAEHQPHKKSESSSAGSKLRKLRKVRKTPSCPSATPRDGDSLTEAEAGGHMPMFGVELEDAPTSGEDDYVPVLVQLCIKILEARGLDAVGVYRIPGNSAAVNLLIANLNKGFEYVDFNDPRWRDVNVVSSLLKAFFRKLSDPLISNRFYEDFIEANRIQDHQQRLIRLRQLIKKLPRMYYDTLRYLMVHLSKVVAHSGVNKMEARNLALMFGPSLVRPSGDSMTTMVTHMSDQVKIVESLIVYSHWLFSEDSSLQIPSPSSEPFPSNSFSDMSDLLKRVSKTEEDLEKTKDSLMKTIQSVHRRNSKPRLDPVTLAEAKLAIGGFDEEEAGVATPKHVSSAPAAVSAGDSKKKYSERNIDEEIALRSSRSTGPCPSSSASDSTTPLATPPTANKTADGVAAGGRVRHPSSDSARELQIGAGDLEQLLSFEDMRRKREADMFTARRIFITGSESAAAFEFPPLTPGGAGTPASDQMATGRQPPPSYSTAGWNSSGDTSTSGLPPPFLESAALGINIHPGDPNRPSGSVGERSDTTGPQGDGLGGSYPAPPHSPLTRVDPTQLNDVLSPETREKIRQFKSESQHLASAPAAQRSAKNPVRRALNESFVFPSPTPAKPTVVPPSHPSIAKDGHIEVGTASDPVGLLTTTLQSPPSSTFSNTANSTSPRDLLRITTTAGDCYAPQESPQHPAGYQSLLPLPSSVSRSSSSEHNPSGSPSPSAYSQQAYQSLLVPSSSGSMIIGGGCSSTGASSISQKSSGSVSPAHLTPSPAASAGALVDSALSMTSSVDRSWTTGDNASVTSDYSTTSSTMGCDPATGSSLVTGGSCGYPLANFDSLPGGILPACTVSASFTFRGRAGSGQKSSVTSSGSARVPGTPSNSGSPATTPRFVPTPQFAEGDGDTGGSGESNTPTAGTPKLSAASPDQRSPLRANKHAHHTSVSNQSSADSPSPLFTPSSPSNFVRHSSANRTSSKDSGIGGGGMVIRSSGHTTPMTASVDSGVLLIGEATDRSSVSSAFVDDLSTASGGVYLDSPYASSAGSSSAGGQLIGGGTATTLMPESNSGGKWSSGSGCRRYQGSRSATAIVRPLFRNSGSSSASRSSATGESPKLSSQIEDCDPKHDVVRLDCYGKRWYENEDVLDEDEGFSSRIGGDWGKQRAAKAGSEPPVGLPPHPTTQPKHSGNLAIDKGVPSLECSPVVMKSASGHSVASSAPSSSSGSGVRTFTSSAASRISQKIKFRNRGSGHGSHGSSAAEKRKDSRRHTLANLTDIENIKTLLFGGSTSSSGSNSAKENKDAVGGDSSAQRRTAPLLVASSSFNAGRTTNSATTSHSSNKTSNSSRLQTASSLDNGSDSNGSAGKRSGPFDRTGSMKIFKRERSTSRTPGRIRSWFKESFRKSSPDLTKMAAGETGDQNCSAEAATDKSVDERSPQLDSTCASSTHNTVATPLVTTERTINASFNARSTVGMASKAPSVAAGPGLAPSTCS